MNARICHARTLEEEEEEEEGGGGGTSLDISMQPRERKKRLCYAS